MLRYWFWKSLENSFRYLMWFINWISYTVRDYLWIPCQDKSLDAWFKLDATKNGFSRPLWDEGARYSPLTIKSKRR